MPARTSPARARSADTSMRSRASRRVRRRTRRAVHSTRKWSIRSWRSRCRSLRANGLRVDSINGDFVVPKVNATDDPKTVGPVDVVLLAVKTSQIPEVLKTIQPLIGNDTAVIPLENGMDAPEQIANAVGREHAMGGLCAIVS